jgi:hypothetical protein
MSAMSALLLIGGFAKLSLPLGAVAAACGAGGVLAIRQPHRSLHAGISGTVAITSIAGLAGAAAFAFDTDGMPLWMPMACAASMLGMWLGEAPPFRASRAASGLARVIGVAAPALLVLALAVTRVQRASSIESAYASPRDAVEPVHVTP